MAVALPLVIDRIHMTVGVTVASRTIIWSLIEQLRVSLMPLFHGLCCAMLTGAVGGCTKPRSA